MKKTDISLTKNHLAAQIISNKSAYLMLLPLVLSLFLFNYWPMLGIQIAFKNYRISQSMWNAEWAGLKWFIQFFSSRQFPTVVKNTLSFSFLTLIIGFPLPIILALTISEIRIRSIQRAVQTITYMPYFVSTVITVVLIRNVFASNGIINIIFAPFMQGKTIIFFQEPGWFKIIYFVMVIWKFTGFDSIVYLGAIAGIDPGLYEAAFIDGAGRLSRIWYITVKGIMPTIAIMLILRVGRILDVCWMEILLLQNDITLEASEVIQTYLYKRGILGGAYSIGTALGLLTSFFGLGLLLITNHLARKFSDEEISMF
jgi:putative aldouronate transport system permease protein